MRKIILGLLAATAVAAPIAMTATAANAATTTAPSGSTVFLSKSTLQSTLHLNNAGFDALKASDFKATGTFTAVQEVHFVCNDAEVSHYDWPTAYADAVTATPVYNGNHTQITGYNVTDNGTVGEPAVRNPIKWDQVNTACDTAQPATAARDRLAHQHVPLRLHPVQRDRQRDQRGHLRARPDPPAPPSSPSRFGGAGCSRAARGLPPHLPRTTSSPRPTRVGGCFMQTPPDITSAACARPTGDLRSLEMSSTQMTSSSSTQASVPLPPGRLACASCGISAPVDPALRLERRVEAANLSGSVRHEQVVALTRCPSCAERASHAAALVAAHPRIAARLGDRRPVEATLTALEALALLGRPEPDGDPDDASLSLHLRHLGFGSVAYLLDAALGMGAPGLARTSPTSTASSCASATRRCWPNGSPPSPRRVGCPPTP